MNIKEIIKDTVRMEDVVARLGLDLKRHGNSMLGYCPLCYTNAGGEYFNVNVPEDFFKCFSCGIAGDIISLVELVNQLDFEDCLRWLADIFRPDLLHELDRHKAEASAGVKEYYQKASLYGLIFGYGKKLLYEPEGREALDYLVSKRGYQVGKLEQTSWIYFPPDKEIRAFLLSQHPHGTSEVKDQIGRLQLNGYYGDNFRLAIPHRDRRGAITGFSKRATAPEGIRIKADDGKIHEKVRWDKTPGIEQRDLFNLYICKGYDTVLMVEGLPDALILPTLGLRNVVALGQAILSTTHIEGLRSFGVKKVIISFDNEPCKKDGTITGLENTEIAIGLLNNSGITSFVIDPPLLSPHKDPDEFVRDKGIDAFLALKNSAQRGAKWKAKRILSKHDIKSDMGNRNALDEAMLFWWTLRDPIDSAQFKETVRVALNVPHGTFDQFTQEYHEKKAKERLKRGYQDFFKEGQRLLQEGDLSSLRELFDDKLRDLRVKRVNRAIEPPCFDDYRQRLKNKPNGLITGYGALDDLISIPWEAITIVGGRSLHGKTTFLLNLFLNMIRTYIDNAFFFFSYEHTAHQMISRVINNLSGYTFENNNNTIELEKYIKGGEKRIPQIDKGIEQFKAYTEEGKRLWIMDEPCFVDELIDTLTYLSERYDTGAVFIDYLQKLRIKGDHGTRQIELQKISEMLLGAALALKIPIILGAQLGRDWDCGDKVGLSNLGEVGVIVNDAQLVLTLFNPSMQKAQNEGVEITTSEVDLKVTIQKNIDGPANVSKKLRLHRPTSTIK